MVEDTLRGLVSMLTVVGGVALVVRLGRAGVGVALRAAEAAAAGGMADSSARRGDLTGMMERRDAERRARRARHTALLQAALWLAWLVLPPVADVAREAYALAAILWLLPRQPLRAPPAPPPSE